MGVIFVTLGFVNLGSNTVLGAIQSAGGLIDLISVSLVQRMNKHIIAFKDGESGDCTKDCSGTGVYPGRQSPRFTSN